MPERQTECETETARRYCNPGRLGDSSKYKMLKTSMGFWRKKRLRVGCTLAIGSVWVQRCGIGTRPVVSNDPDKPGKAEVRWNQVDLVHSWRLVMFLAPETEMRNDPLEWKTNNDYREGDCTEQLVVRSRVCETR